MIATVEHLEAFLPRVRAAEWVAMDTEADSLHSYPEKLCLVQISVAEEDVLVDPLAGVNLTPLWDTLAGRELIMHGADYDLRLLHRGQSFVPHSVFDTMIAARLIGMTEFGLDKLASNLLGVTLEKGPQRANWSRRPLNDRLLNYARNDSHYLKPLAQLLEQRLTELARLEWHRQVCARLIADSTHFEPPKLDSAWRIKGADRLERRALAVLRELWRWREREALAANRPPFFVLSHDSLLAIAEASVQESDFAPLIPRRYSPARRRGLIKAVEHGLGLPESRWPHPRQRGGVRLTQNQRRHLEELRRRRDHHAAQLQLDPTLIASKSVLISLAADWDTQSAQLMPWQRELLTSDAAVAC